MAAPSGNYDRLNNLGRSNASAGLQAQHGGRISANASRKIRNAIEWLLAAAEEKYVYSKRTKKFHKWKLSFLTLTLPTQSHLTDIEVKSILNSFLTLAKYNYGLKSYVWKAEPQRRGVIHFHLTSDCYMWKESVRFEWNRLLSKSGLLNGHPDAPSTKIHSTYKVKNMAAYLTKYFCKPDPRATKPPYKPKMPGIEYQCRGHVDMHPLDLNSLAYIRPIGGRLWGCSQTLSKARSLSYIVDQGEMRSLNQEMRDAKAKESQKPWCNYFQLPDDYYEKLSPGQLKHDYLLHLHKIRKRKKFHQFEVFDEEGQLISDRRVLKQIQKSQRK